jgi:UDP-2,3-diacylglucosamine pyrophosphatase LpxH
MKTYTENSLLFVGDIHGDWSVLEDLCLKRTTNSLFIQVGDVGLGFKSKTSEMWDLKKINDLCVSTNNRLILMRGNHDSKQRFLKLRNENNFSHVLLARDYEVVSWKGKTIQFIGGAISIDRMGREIDKSYWADEEVDFKKDLCQKVDILVTHTCPSFCYPQSLSSMVLDWARHEKDRFGTDLLKELTEERQKLNQIFEICQPSLHVYGHFHSSHAEILGDCKHRLMDINEVWEHQTPYEN